MEQLEALDVNRRRPISFVVVFFQQIPETTKNYVGEPDLNKCSHKADDEMSDHSADDNGIFNISGVVWEQNRKLDYTIDSIAQ